MFLLRKVMAVALALVVLSVPVLAFQGSEPGAAGGDETRWLVNDAEYVFKLNVKQLLGSALIKKIGTEKLTDAIKNNNDLSNLLEATGIDITKDIHQIMVSGQIPTPGTQPKDVKGQLVIQGKFDADKIGKALKKREEVRAVKEGTVQLYEITTQGQTLFAAFPDDKTLVLTSNKDATVEAVKGAKKASVTKMMKTATKNFSGKESLSLAVVINEDMKKQLVKAPGGAGEAASKLQTVTAGLTVTESIALNVTGFTDDAKAAKTLADLIIKGRDGGKGAITGDDPLSKFATDLLDAVKIAGMKDSVTVDLKISKDTIDKVLKLAGGVR